MDINNLLKGYRNELDEVIEKHLPKENKLIDIENIDEYHSYLQTIEFDTKLGKTIAFTNGNSWYIPTLIKNLIKTMFINETYNCKLGVICSDKKAFELCDENNIKNKFYVSMPLLKVEKLNDVKKDEDYRRLVYVKTVLIHNALKFGYNVIYIDPDMAFMKPSFEYIIDKTYDHGLVLAGIKNGNMDTNIIGVIPTDKHIELFKVDYNTIEATILNSRIYKRFCGSDEEYLIMKEEYEPEKIHFLDIKLFPPGKYVSDSDEIMMLHANGVSGLYNKIEFLHKNHGWYLW